MINLDAIKITPRDEEVLRLPAQGCSNKEIAGAPQYQSAHRETTSPCTLLARWNHRGSEASEISNCNVCQGADGIMHPRDQLTPKEIQLATLVWEGLTNRDLPRLSAQPSRS